MATKLKTKLSWLNYSYGKAERLARVVNKKVVHFPAIYANDLKDGYLNLFPDDGYGNTCFFITDEYEIDEYLQYQKMRVRCNFGLIFWFNAKTVLNSIPEYYNVESIKADILRALSEMTLTTSRGRINITSIQDRVEEIYDDFTIDEIKNQFLMYPYAGLRFNGEASIYESCP